MAILLHGTTRHRAERIGAYGPDPNFVEPGAVARAESFSTSLAGGPDLFGSPEEYACGKAAQFPGEGGAAILKVEVPDEIIALAVDESFPLSQGLVQFDEAKGLKELLETWPRLSKKIRSVVCPMNTQSQLSGALESALERPARGVLGLVDDLLRLCPQQGLQLQWQADRCRIRSLANGSEEVLDPPLRRSVFRAILARMAALCNERNPNSVSPYGGQGELIRETDPSVTFRVTFTNTVDEQKLQIIPYQRG